MRVTALRFKVPERRCQAYGSAASFLALKSANGAARLFVLAA